MKSNVFSYDDEQYEFPEGPSPKKHKHPHHSTKPPSLLNTDSQTQLNAQFSVLDFTPPPTYKFQVRNTYNWEENTKRSVWSDWSKDVMLKHEIRAEVMDNGSKEKAYMENKPNFIEDIWIYQKNKVIGGTTSKSFDESNSIGVAMALSGRSSFEKFFPSKSPLEELLPIAYPSTSNQAPITSDLNSAFVTIRPNTSSTATTLSRISKSRKHKQKNRASTKPIMALSNGHVGSTSDLNQTVTHLDKFATIATINTETTCLNISSASGLLGSLPSSQLLNASTIAMDRHRKKSIPNIVLATDRSFATLSLENLSPLPNNQTDKAHINLSKFKHDDSVSVSFVNQTFVAKAKQTRKFQSNDKLKPLNSNQLSLAISPTIAVANFTTKSLGNSTTVTMASTTLPQATKSNQFKRYIKTSNVSMTTPLKTQSELNVTPTKSLNKSIPTMPTNFNRNMTVTMLRTTQLLNTTNLGVELTTKQISPEENHTLAYNNSSIPTLNQTQSGAQKNFGKSAFWIDLKSENMTELNKTTIALRSNKSTLSGIVNSKISSKTKLNPEALQKGSTTKPGTNFGKIIAKDPGFNTPALKGSNLSKTQNINSAKKGTAFWVDYKSGNMIDFNSTAKPPNFNKSSLIGSGNLRGSSKTKKFSATRPGAGFLVDQKSGNMTAFNKSFRAPRVNNGPMTLNSQFKTGPKLTTNSSKLQASQNATLNMYSNTNNTLKFKRVDELVSKNKTKWVSPDLQVSTQGPIRLTRPPATKRRYKKSKEWQDDNDEPSTSKMVNIDSPLTFETIVHNHSMELTTSVFAKTSNVKPQKRSKVNQNGRNSTAVYLGAKMTNSALTNSGSTPVAEMTTGHNISGSANFNQTAGVRSTATSFHTSRPSFETATKVLNNRKKSSKNTLKKFSSRPVKGLNETKIEIKATLPVESTTIPRFVDFNISSPEPITKALKTSGKQSQGSATELSRSDMLVNSNSKIIHEERFNSTVNKTHVTKTITERATTHRSDLSSKSLTIKPILGDQKSNCTVIETETTTTRLFLTPSILSNTTVSPQQVAILVSKNVNKTSRFPSAKVLNPMTQRLNRVNQRSVNLYRNHNSGNDTLVILKKENSQNMTTNRATSDEPARSSTNRMSNPTITVSPSINFLNSTQTLDPHEVKARVSTTTVKETLSHHNSDTQDPHHSEMNLTLSSMVIPSQRINDNVLVFNDTHIPHNFASSSYQPYQRLMNATYVSQKFVPITYHPIHSGVNNTHIPHPFTPTTYQFHEIVINDTYISHTPTPALNPSQSVINDTYIPQSSASVFKYSHQNGVNDTHIPHSLTSSTYQPHQKVIIDTHLSHTSASIMHNSHQSGVMDTPTPYTFGSGSQSGINDPLSTMETKNQDVKMRVSLPNNPLIHQNFVSTSSTDHPYQIGVNQTYKSVTSQAVNSSVPLIINLTIHQNFVQTSGTDHSSQSKMNETLSGATATKVQANRNLSLNEDHPISQALVQENRIDTKSFPSNILEQLMTSSRSNSADSMRNKTLSIVEQFDNVTLDSSTIKTEIGTHAQNLPSRGSFDFFRHTNLNAKAMSSESPRTVEGDKETKLASTLLEGITKLSEAFFSAR